MLDARVRKRRREIDVDIAFQLDDGESLGIFGPSGSGKSTVLSCIAGIEIPDEGSAVSLDGVRLFPPPLALRRRPIGYLTQDVDLFPHLTVRENVTFGLPALGGAADLVWIDELAGTLALREIWNAPASRISGGQARRAGVARMLARQPRLVLLDEPFAGLDRNVTRDLILAIDRWRTRLGFSLLVVDHEPGILERVSPRALVIEHGRTVQSGAWESLYASPATPTLHKLLAPL